MAAPLRTPSRLPAPASDGTTQRKALQYPQPLAPLLPNTSPAPFRRKRPFAGTQANAEASERPPPTLHKIVIQEELDQLHVVVQAGQVLDLALAQDEAHVELEDAVMHPDSTDPYIQTACDFLVTSRKPLPAALFEHLRIAQQTNPSAQIASGLLPAIHRVWFSIDKKLYLWDYEEGAPLFEFSDLRDVVLTVTVVPKNRELFTHKVSHMLLISTPMEIAVYGVVHEPFFNLLPTGLTVTTNEYRCTHFAWHENGRIFTGGSEGKVLELTYDYYSMFSNAKVLKRRKCGPGLTTWLISWFSRVEVQELVCDSSRNLLYALLTCDTLYSPFQIDVYDLGPSGTSMNLAMSIDAWTFLQRLRDSNISLASVSPTRLDIQHIFPIPRSLSLDYHLLIVLKNGIRVLLSLYVDIPQAGMFSKNTVPEDDAMSYRPTGEYALTVKLPPISIDSYASFYPTQRPITVGFTSDKPSNHDQMVLLDDASLLLLEHSNTGSRLIAIRRSLSRISHLQTDSDTQISDPAETISCVDEFHQTPVQCISEVATVSNTDVSLAELCGLLPRNAFVVLPPVRWLNENVFSLHCLTGLGNTLYIQPGKFQVVTETQWMEYMEMRPVDVVYNILEEGGNKERDRLVDVCARFSVTHVCAMLLALALSPCMYLRRVSVSEATLEPVSPSTRQKASRLFQSLSTAKLETPSLPGMPPVKEPDITDPLLALTDHQALALYLSRILRPIWAETVAYTDPDSRTIVEQFKTDHFRHIRDRLHPFTEFIEQNYPGSLQELQHSNILKLPDRVRGKDPVMDMYLLAQRALQAVNLLELLQEDFGFRRMAMELPPNEQNSLKFLTFKELIATESGHFLSKSLVEAYIRQLQMSRSSRSKRLSIDEVLHRFIQAAPAYFTPADAEICLAQEALARARVETEYLIRSEYLKAAIQRLMKNAASIAIRRISEELLREREVMPVVSLCIKKARDLGEIRGSEASREMEECYETIFMILEDVHQSISLRAALCIPYLSHLSLDSLTLLESEILQECCKVPHKPMHWHLFHWLVSHNLAHRIVQLDSPYVLEYISTELDTESHPELPLLPEYAMKSKDYKRAYLEYGRLATLRQESGVEFLPLGRRCEYLELSLVCLETYIKDFKGTENDLKKLQNERISLELSLRLAKIQRRIQQELLSKVETNKDLLLESENLDKMLLTVDELYEKIAKPRQLFEMQLELLHFHHETSMVQTPNTTSLMRANFIPIIEGLRSQQWPLKVAEKLEELGKKYPYSFPVDLICKHCEAINLDLGVEKPWVIQLVLGLPVMVDMQQLLEIYREIWESQAGNSGSAWLVFIRLERLMSWWVEIAERKSLPGAAYWESPHSSKCSLDRLSVSIPSVLSLLDHIETCVFPAPQQGQVHTCIADLRDKFTQLSSRLKSKPQANPQQADTPRFAYNID